MTLLALAMPTVGALVQLLFAVGVIGLLLYWVSTFPMPEPFKTGVFVIGALILIVIVAAAFGVW